jgi:hypothetical protein
VNTTNLLDEDETMVCEVYPEGLTQLPFTDSLNEDEARIPALLAKLLEQLD